MMVYMGKTKLTRALYLARNKDTDELYSERVKFEAAEFKSIMLRMKRIIESIQPPDRCANRSDDFRCGYCDAKKICWGVDTHCVPLPSITCRTCCHATPETDRDGAVWTCNRGGKLITLDGTDNPCEYHLLIPGLILECNPVDGNDDWIEFVNEDGQTWRHGHGTDGNIYMTTQDLISKTIHDEP
jgi:hypothetical protein